MAGPYAQARSLATRWGITTWKEEHPPYVPDKMHYLTTIQHRAPETGKLHWHTFVILKKRTTMNNMKNIIKDDQAHLIRLFKDDTSYIDDGHDAITEQLEFGIKISSGTRTDITAFRDAIKRGDSLIQLIEDHPAAYMR